MRYLPKSKTATSDAVPYHRGTIFRHGIFARTLVPLSAVIIIALLYPPSFFSIRVMGEPATRGSAETVRQSSRMSKDEYRFASSYPSLTRKRPLLYPNRSFWVAGLPDIVSCQLSGVQ